MNAFGKTDVGLMRTINQDSIFVSTQPIGKLPNLFIVADGMGGHKAGDVASREAIERFVKYACTTHMSDPANILDAGIISVNKDIFDMANSNRDYSGMGTTFVAASLVENHVYIANVGDSRLYLIGRDIRQITRDHSLVEDMVRMGVLEREEARTHYKKNVITKAIGVADDKTSTPDIFEIEVENGDKLLLCSDGLTNMVEDYDIKKIVKDNDSIEDAVRELIKQANENGGKDNISAILIEPEIGEE
ncbi:Stp1/IreP family PP2C-type Ser/Thr phosphatase [Eubacterium sp. AF15-50]|uniref:Stp1/IreP family PP2C-type Ser/Thr phosphatase n=1 Tax=Eubacterium segne TaxID=2763045 RepID=A0ABR7F259_9FIRM|nr:MULTISPECIES: Stp1/IreP family PP2C-type Ser/Thr phosphatase [unclassified Eubacterium (in: firmicutes)]MBC5666910.1 Stp1/IreP family PP2C-type Ser/Thr phosphatase [Eubacterium segne]RHR73765.1 Stp1/IreP family PP2C-type Ser/Thr phosphatase [Eubacterium sp. AF16-48]RHR81442.1 Stp1/IreP family PP2C-type Ser/Thr phosphatase [Eubacterium sp. AF15-50]